MNATQRYWILTIPSASFAVPESLSPKLSYLRGQLERADSGYVHWQLVAHFKKPARLAAVKKLFGSTCHAEPCKSKAALDYVWKDETAVEGTRFEKGSLPASPGTTDRDWHAILRSAKAGEFDEIPPDVLVRCYSSIRKIASDFGQPVAVERTVHVFVGRTGTGKSRRAWSEAGLSSYPKNPATKFWDGYRGHQHVVMDEFRGLIGIHNLLLWFDRYPVIVEIKGSSAVLRATTFWVTSNLHPTQWYPDLDMGTLDALLRRINIVVFD
ncbi:MAG: helicase [Kajamanuvirus cruti]|uniref:Replication-associated protein n=1 Tax=Cressdnaviricota sp. TaxID=2748378 RepID=A0A3G2YT59_9VIRU|nr:MAG: helicase [Cressdnaviricota sp.]